MSVKKYKPVTPSLRHMIKVIKPVGSEGSNGKDKLIISRINKTGGRNNSGKITIRHRGGGHKQRYRLIDRKRQYGQFIKAEVKSIDYNPSSSGFLARLTDEKKEWYILAANGLKEKDIIKGEWYQETNIEKITNQLGECRKLKDMNIGSEIFNIDGKWVRSAGTKAILLRQLEKTSLIKLPSGKIREIDHNILATFGQVSNIDHNKIVKGKAGVNRWLGIRPTVRGEAMNPVDHPHGGKSHGSGGLGNAQRTKWGKLAKKSV